MDQRGPGSGTLTRLDDDLALHTILAGTTPDTAPGSIEALVGSLCAALGTAGAWVTEYHAGTRTLRALAFWLHGGCVTGGEYNLAGTPCEPVIAEGRLVHVRDEVRARFPAAPGLLPSGAVSYLGIPLVDGSRPVLGHLAICDDKPMSVDPRTLALCRVVASRAGVELLRLRAEAAVHENEQRLAGLVDSALDAVLDVDAAFVVTGVNPAGEQTFGRARGEMIGQPVGCFLGSESTARLRQLCASLAARADGPRALRIADGLTGRRGDGVEFPVEASLSRFDVRGRTCFTLVLRNVNDRLEAERTIRTLANEAEYLRDELRQVRNLDVIEGQSEGMRRVLQDVTMLADSDTTVLVHGEAGTGKELVARAIHGASSRRRMPMVVINCGARPEGGIESELFGQEPGAGSAAGREGRLALADGGTVFLDEVGDLPMELQPRLLRVLQHREFEPAGGTRTRTVDVRIIAATSRDLAAEARAGRFREDLLYRLNVFPIAVPALRQRGDDVIRLAEVFAERAARRLRRPLRPLDLDARTRLRQYAWPGNVRELQHVIERAVMTARDGRLDLTRALGLHVADLPSGPADTGAVYTIDEMKSLERANIVRALERTRGRVAGAAGAARLLNMRPSTLSSRIAALGIALPRHYA